MKIMGSFFCENNVIQNKKCNIQKKIKPKAEQLQKYLVHILQRLQRT